MPKKECDVDMQKMMETLKEPVPTGAWEAAQGIMYMVKVTTPAGDTAPFVETNKMRRVWQREPEESVLRVFPSHTHALAFQQHIVLDNEIIPVTLQEAFEEGAKVDRRYRKSGMGPVRIDLSVMLANGYPRTVDVLFTALAERH
jgi:hypothetical protein